MTTTTETRIEAGAILVSSWGYDQTNRDFYRVLRRTPKTVTLIQLEAPRTDAAESGKPAALYGTTTPGKEIGEPFRRAVKDWGSGEKVAICSYEYAKLWDGQPAKYTAYA